MPGVQQNSSDKVYLRIVGGNIVQKVNPGTDGARLRQYELPNGTKGEKWENVFMSWEGKIKSIVFKENDYGEDCIIELGDAYLALAVDGRYFSDFASKVFSGDIAKAFLFHPYDMEGDNGKKKSGISLQQEGEKLKNYFYDGKENLHGFPVPKEGEKTKNYWKIFFAEVSEFLKGKIEELKFDDTVEKEEVYPNDDNDLPF